MRIPRKFRRLLAGAATLPLLIGGLTLATAGPADAIDCPYPQWTDWDKEGAGTSGSGTIPVHYGPAGSCRIDWWVDGGDLLYYHCYVVNDAGNSWTHVRIQGTQHMGWVWDNYLTDHGSKYHC